MIPARALIATASLWLGAGCADLLGFQPGFASESMCSSSSECAPDEMCQDSTCLPSTCHAGQKRCHGLKALQCGAEQTWEIMSCAAMCSEGECVVPKSCGSSTLVCAGNASCCESIEIKGGRSFTLSYAYPDPASQGAKLATDGVSREIHHFALDRFEVTAGRFKQFVLSYNTLGPPDESAGAHPAFPTSGWQTAWNDDAERYPGSQAALETLLRQNEQDASDDTDLQLPIRGVNWYVAMAFCIWDDARLPTEAEWAYAAFGGTRGYDYPWADLDDSVPPIDHHHAQYCDDMKACEGPSHVGAHESGQGVFGQDDLAGNLEEWVADKFNVRLPRDCHSEHGMECLQLEGAENRVTRGGSYRDFGDLLRNVHRSSEVAFKARPWIGFRCARDLVARE